MSDSNHERVRERLQVTKSHYQPPQDYRVILHNDDYTTMEFVVDILTGIFHHPKAVAVKIMLSVHQNGRGIAGIYSKEIAEAKAAQVTSRARAEEFPLLCTIEPVE